MFKSEFLVEHLGGGFYHITSISTILDAKRAAPNKNKFSLLDGASLNNLQRYHHGLN